jgi:CRISPR-associated endoribonuclease Cas6
MNYQQIIQGFLYRVMEDREFGYFLHEEGYHHGKRVFKLFTYSRLSGDFRTDSAKKTITFHGEIRLQIGSVIPKFIQEIGKSLLKAQTLQWNGQNVEIVEIGYREPEIHDSVCKIRMISPITVYSTYESEEGKKTTQYFDPDDPAFAHLIRENLRKKYEAYYGRTMDGTFAIRALQVKPSDKVITRFKDFLISAWNGIYEITGTPEILRFAYGTGLGGRNSQGFGMFDIIATH